MCLPASSPSCWWIERTFGIGSYTTATRLRSRSPVTPGTGIITEAPRALLGGLPGKAAGGAATSISYLVWDRLPAATCLSRGRRNLGRPRVRIHQFRLHHSGPPHPRSPLLPGISGNSRRRRLLATPHPSLANRANRGCKSPPSPSRSHQHDNGSPTEPARRCTKRPTSSTDPLLLRCELLQGASETGASHETSRHKHVRTHTLEHQTNPSPKHPSPLNPIFEYHISQSTSVLVSCRLPDHPV